MNDLYIYLNKYITDNKLDGLFFNSSNDYLMEYNILELNSSYKLTGFSGSQSYVLYTKDKIYLFVDTRYHVQAELEVDNKLVNIIKVPLEVSPFSELIDKIPEKFKLGVPSKRISKNFADKLRNELAKKKSEIIVLDNDIINEYTNNYFYIDVNCEKIDEKISGVTPNEKIVQLRKKFKKNYALIITSLEDCAYLTNLRAYNFPYSSSFPMKMIITENTATAYANIEYSENDNSIEYKYLDDFYNDIKAIVNKNVFVAKQAISEFDYNLINTNNKINDVDFSFLRIQKNKNEIEHLKYCFKQTDNALKTIEDMINSDNIYSEYDYSKALTDSLYNNFARNLSFKSIVACGKNSAIIHYSKSDKNVKIKNGDLLLVDYGAYFDGGYATDTTRTFIKGKPTKEQKRVYTTVLKAFLNSYHKKSKQYYDIDLNARKIIEKELGSEYPFAHSTGHGVGINVHEVPPRVSNSEISKIDLIPNTVFSIEPGAYKENFGGVRLENTVYIKETPKGYKIQSLSKYKFEDKLVDKTLLNKTELKWYNDWQDKYERNYIRK